MMFRADNVVVEPGSLVLVTGGNGLIGSHCVNETLAAGYRVRSTVRDVKRCNWMKEFFDKKYPGKFELFEVPDVLADGYLDDAVKGVSAVIHTVPINSSIMETKPEPSTSHQIKTVIQALEAAKKESTIRRFVLTSSTWAAWPYAMTEPHSFDQNSWNESSVERAYSTELPGDALQIFMSAKTRLEQEAWNWAKESKPAFVLNTVLAATVMGNILAPKHQSLETTGAIVKSLYEGGPEMALDYLRMLGPGIYIDAADCGKLHLIAAVDPDVENERLFGHAGSESWNEILDVLRKNFPNKKFVDNISLQRNPAIVPRERGDTLLKKHYGQGWTDIEECVMANLKSLVELE